MMLSPCVSGIFLSLATLIIFSSCRSITVQDGAMNPRTIDKTVPEYKNPFPANTYEHFVASKEYPKTYGTYRDEPLLTSKVTKQKKKIVICLKEQRGRYYINDKVAIDFPVSTGVRAHPTSTGSYQVIGKKVNHASNLYGKIYDAKGKCIDYSANATDAIPEGGRFAGSKMPYWQRLTNDGLGLHVGKVRRTPQSHGCIRIQSATAKTLFAQTSIGTPVSIQQLPEGNSESIPSKKD
ncbi:MAG: L,D-transpeptidase family protein [Akkermansia sp.]